MANRRHSTAVTTAAVAAASLFLGACSAMERGTANPDESVDSPAGSPMMADAMDSDRTAQLNSWLEEVFEAQVARSPVSQTYLGRKTNYDRWDDATPEFAARAHLEDQAWAKEVRANFDPGSLDASGRLSRRLFLYNRELEHAAWRFRDHFYVFTQFRGPHEWIPAFLINQHRVDDVGDARDYIARIKDARRALLEYLANFQRSYTKGIHPPRWSYLKMLDTARNVITGEPFDDSGKVSPILADFRKKLAALELAQADATRLEIEAGEALIDDFKPAYEELIAMFEAHAEVVDNRDGVWKLPDGDEYYRYLLRNYTTTDMTPEDIHQLGLAEVRRIHEEMLDIMKRVDFQGSLQDFFRFTREDDQFYYPNTTAGRADYMRKAKQLIDNIQEVLPRAFNIFPKAELVVRRVEAFREAAAGKAFYQRPAPNGSRPGVYYANLRDTRQMPIYQMEALAFHEGIPGHHMQIAIAQELESVPSFRRYGGYTAYVEGWGLYSEYLPKEMGFYQDDYSDFGRLAMELWRAARLVVDTGLHHKRWTREQAIAYLVENTPNPADDCRAAIERYIVFPGQATAYKIGMNEILRLREGARAQLGEAFDLREYHDVVLARGSVPLVVLGELVDEWIASKK